ncbi:MAG: HEAT repeat domain-containing protein [Elainella sp.]
MSKSRKLEALQADLNQIRAEPTTEAAQQILRQALSSKFGVAIAQAARIVRDAELVDLLPDLATSFSRLLENPVNDPNCIGKRAIADTLYRLSYPETELFLVGIRHVQMEPVWGGQVDTAAGLRATCALGLVRSNYLEMFNELADLLADPEPEARIGAARALAYSGSLQAVPLLRLRVQIGDDASVLADCFSALLQLAPTASLSLVARFLQSPNPQISETAALALGESRLPAALPYLQQWWQQSPDSELRQTGLLAIAMLRQEEAIEFLLSLLTLPRSQAKTTAAALAALQLYTDDSKLMARVKDLVNANKGEPEP